MANPDPYAHLPSDVATFLRATNAKPAPAAAAPDASGSPWVEVGAIELPDNDAGMAALLKQLEAAGIGFAPEPSPRSSKPKRAAFVPPNRTARKPYTPLMPDSEESERGFVRVFDEWAYLPVKLSFRSPTETEQEILAAMLLPAGYKSLLLPDGDPLYGMFDTMDSAPPRLYRTREREALDFSMRLRHLQGDALADQQMKTLKGGLLHALLVLMDLVSRASDGKDAYTWLVPFGVRVWIDTITNGKWYQPQVTPDYVKRWVKSASTVIRQTIKTVRSEPEQRNLLLMLCEIEIAGRALVHFVHGQPITIAAKKEFESHFNAAQKHGGFGPSKVAARDEERKALVERGREFHGSVFAEGEHVPRFDYDKNTDRNRKRRENLSVRNDRAQLPMGIPGGAVAAAPLGLADEVNARVMQAGLERFLAADEDPFFGLFVQRGALSQTEGVRDREAASLLEDLELIRDTVNEDLESNLAGQESVAHTTLLTNLLQLANRLTDTAKAVRARNRPMSMSRSMRPEPFAVQVLKELKAGPVELEKMFQLVLGVPQMIFGGPKLPHKLGRAVLALVCSFLSTIRVLFPGDPISILYKNDIDVATMDYASLQRLAAQAQAVWDEEMEKQKARRKATADKARAKKNEAKQRKKAAAKAASASVAAEEEEDELEGETGFQWGAEGQ